MGKKIKKNKKSLVKSSMTTNEIESRRTGGQIALTGYSYQLLYSCYIVLHFLNMERKIIKLEGIEDVDTFRTTIDDRKVIEHIQLKFSKDKQDASFFKSILTNYLEVFLTDKENFNRYFKLVYDMEISKGNLSQLIGNTLNMEGKKYWGKIIGDIKKSNPSWSWIGFDFDRFINQLRFERLSRSSIALNIEQLLIDKFNINTGNEKLFLNSLFYNVFHSAKDRNNITYNDLSTLIQDTKDNIAKGYQNKAYLWVDKIDFNNFATGNNNHDYFEGKKATPADIANGDPIRREKLENIVEQSIRDNKITIIKSSSGQGKTTLAWQSAYNLREEFHVYKLNWCKESKEISNIVEYFTSRLKLGEKILIVLDNLDIDLKEWNKLAQVLDEKISINYSLLVTTREDDWYTFAGDQSSLGELKIIDLFLDNEQAKKIYDNLKMKDKIHESINSWQSAWEKVQSRQLLIEYVYLLTHGEMIEERVVDQLKKISNSKGASIKLELLRQIALADIIGVKLQTTKLIEQFTDATDEDCDLNYIIGSIENEYFIKINEDSYYIEGLHPVRSQHIVDSLHKHYSISTTLSKLFNIVDELYIAKLYAQLPLLLKTEKDEFYMALARKSAGKSYSYMVKTLQGLFSGSILNYSTFAPKKSEQSLATVRIQS